MSENIFIIVPFDREKKKPKDDPEWDDEEWDEEDWDILLEFSWLDNLE